MNWNKIDNSALLEKIDTISKQQKVLIFKHSTRCSISTAALGRLERKWRNGDELLMKPFFLDLLNFRSISSDIANRYGVEHQSPQVLVISDGKCIFSQTHYEISYEDIMK